MKKLTKKEEETLEAIKDFISKNCYPPTVRELCTTLVKSSPSTVFTKLVNLKKKGYINYVEGKQRTIVVLKND